MRKRPPGSGSVPAVLAAAVFASCGGGSRATDEGCAQTRPVASLSPVQPGPLRLPVAPSRVLICGYDGDGAGLARGGGVRLERRAAAALTGVINTRPGSHPRRRTCRADLSGVTLGFTYATGPPIWVGVFDRGCGAAVAVERGRSFAFDPSLTTDLMAITAFALPVRSGKPGAPDVIGLTADAAGAAARRARLDFEVDGAVIDSAAAAGSVVFQDPVPGGSSELGGLGVTVALAAGPVCRPAQLRVSYQGGGVGSGENFGGIAIRNTSPAACRLRGPLRVTGVSRGGRPVTARLRSFTPRGAVMTPHAVTLRAGAGVPPGQFTARIPLSAGYRDDAGGQGCSAHLVVPFAWRVQLHTGRPRTVRNRDRADTVDYRRGGLVTCGGNAVAAAARIVIGATG